MKPRSHSGPVRAKKHLGQHFLKDSAVSERIADLVPTGSKHQILEVGPGTGALTQPLIQRHGRAVHVVEIDTESVAFLQAADWMNSDHIHSGDLLKSTPDMLGMTGTFTLVGNFPYNISSQILFRALEWRDQVDGCIGMFQKEVALRVCADSGSKVYGILSVLLQNYFSCEYAFTVGPGAFDPPPKVDSGVIRLIRTPDKDPDVDYALLKRVVKAAFGLRRKTLRNALRSGGFNDDAIPEAWRGQRAEQLSPADFIVLTQALQAAL
ncbi:MAG: 16S rRNA (adenine(1518)-N(6)/adenine(1519)-N(6))-dimethyltransferase RsmA [Flavobacteriales bacterium]|nr:16S rRNA (adenine(1518)-N(6)/adenine(1519)-N(6))-dimethyltransferase RsmA [Flavobacteriales bacterium]